MATPSYNSRSPLCLRNHDEAGAAEPWAARAAAQLTKASDSLQIGQSLGPYRIESFLAAGGMGKVYRATDTRLHRKVAMKVSAARFSERFEREARVIASFNHPNICQLYDVGSNYLVMELVEGPTVADRIRRGDLTLEEALPVARQIAEALEAAHEKGRIHRDPAPSLLGTVRPEHAWDDISKTAAAAVSMRERWVAHDTRMSSPSYGQSMRDERQTLQAFQVPVCRPLEQPFRRQGDRR